MVIKFYPVALPNWSFSDFVRFIVAGLYKKLKCDNKQIFTVVYHFLEILHFFQYTTIKMIIFYACKNLLSNKNISKDTQIIVLNGCENFGWRKPSSKLTLKAKWYQSCGCCDGDLRSCAQLKKRVTDKYFEPISPSLTGNVCYHYNSWVTGVHIACLFHRNSGGKTSQIVWLFESNLRSFGCFKCSTAFWLWLSLNLSCKGNSHPK